MAAIPSGPQHSALLRHTRVALPAVLAPFIGIHLPQAPLASSSGKMGTGRLAKLKERQRLEEFEEYEDDGETWAVQTMRTETKFR